MNDPAPATAGRPVRAAAPPPRAGRAARAAWCALAAAAALWVGLEFAPSGHLVLDLLHAGAGAAIVGGLADLFTVTALFRPLPSARFRLPRTDVLRGRQDRIERALVDLLDQEILSSAILTRRLDDLDLVDRLRRLLADEAARAHVVRALESAFGALADAVDPDDLAGWLQRLGEDALRDAPLTPRLAATARRLLRGGAFDRVLTFTARELRGLVQRPGLVDLLLAMIEAVKRAYATGGAMRKLAAALVGSERRIASAILAELRSGLADAERPGHPWRRRLRLMVAAELRRIESDPEHAARIDARVRAFLASPAVRTRLAAFLDAFRATLRPPFDAATEAVATEALVFVEERLLHDDERARALERLAKRHARAWIQRHPGLFQRVVRERFAALGEDGLVELARSRVGADLQWIRVNGTCVGFVVGAVLHLVFRGLEALS